MLTKMIKCLGGEKKINGFTVSKAPDMLLDKIQVFCVLLIELIIWSQSGIAENIIHRLHF